MSNYSVLKQDINNNIYENQTQQITGTVLNAILNEMTASLGAGYQFAGVATLGMNPGDPDQRVFYLAGEGIYTNFGGLQVPQGKLGVLKWDYHWTLQTIDGLGGGGANLTGYVPVASTDDLPEVGQPTLGYLCGTNLYLYVGEGGDTKEGKYQNCGSFRGPQGLQGDPGVGIATVAQTTTSTEDEGINVITVTKEDGTQSTFQVRNGSKGSQGIQGPQGVQGEPGRLQAQYKQVETLPTASADTVDYIYLVASQTPNVYDMYYTEENQGAYSWQPLGTTAVQLSDYATKAEVNQLEAKVDGNLMSVRAKNALLAVFNKVAFAVPDVSAEMSELNNALFNLDEVTGINAVYTQGSTVIWSDGVSVLNDLKANLVVKAEYGDGTEVTVTNYTLSGTLTTGTSVITVEYEDFTTTFSVIVTAYGSKTSYTLTEGSIVNKQGRYAQYTYGGYNYCLGISNYGNDGKRRIFAASFGKQRLRDSVDNQIDIYPVKIPASATKVNISATGNNQQIAGRVVYLLDNGRYIYTGGENYPLKDFPHQTSQTCDISDVSGRTDTYFLCLGKRANDASYSGNEPTEISIIFLNE